MQQIEINSRDDNSHLNHNKRDVKVLWELVMHELRLSNQKWFVTRDEQQPDQ